MTEEQLSVIEIAALPGYKSIIGTFDEEIAVIESELANEIDVQLAVKQLVYWQFLKRIVNILKLYPQQLKELLEAERNNAMYDSLAQMSIPQASAVLRQVWAKKLRDEDGTRTIEELENT